MSCEHGNWPPCDQCDALDAAYARGVEAGRREARKPRPDAAIAILRNGQGLHSEDHVAVRKDALVLVLDYLEGDGQ